RGSGPPLVLRTSASSILIRSSATLSSRLSVSSSWTSDSDGLVGSFDIAAQSRLKFAQPEMLHLATQVPRLDLEAPDALDVFVGIAVELAGVDEHAERQPFAVLFDDVLETGHRAACDSHRGKAADPSHQHIDRAAHLLNPNEEALTAQLEVRSSRCRAAD